MDQPLIFFTAVLVLGIAAQWIAWRFHLPSILLLLTFGFAAGYLGHADPDKLIGRELLFPVVSLSVAVILFEGGLSLQFRDLKDSGTVVIRLVSLGVLVSWLLTATAARQLFGMDGRVAALTGAILVVTGPTVIGPLLRHIRPARQVGSIVKWEGIVIDPIGAVLAVLVFEALFQDQGHIWRAPFLTLVVGTLIGLVTAAVLVQLMKHYWIPDFLHNAVFLTAAICTFALANTLQSESGLLTVTVLGIALANQKSVPVHHVLEFKENLRVLLISCLFVVLASRIKLSDLWEIGWNGLVFLAILIFLIRPASVFMSTFATKLKWRERVFLAFLAPRGIVAAAVSSVFALEVTHLYHDQQLPAGAQQIVPLTFVVIVGTVTVYGVLAAPLARWLGLAEPNPQGVLFAGAASWIRDIAKILQDEGITVLLVDTSRPNIANARMDGLPTQHASILSEYVAEEIDLGGIGRLMAMTPNDDLNTLAAMEFAQVFGRAEVYQLFPWQGGVGNREPSPHIRGRILFGPELTFGSLASRFATGGVVKKTKLSEKFTFEDFRARYGDSSIVMFIIDESARLRICTADTPPTPKPGETLIALVRSAESAAEAGQDAPAPESI